MSYKFTAYFDDPGIKTTEIYWGEQNIKYTRNYGDTALVQSGFYGSMRFAATAKSGYSFWRWAYHIGSINAETQYDYNTVFTYSGEQDIWIGAKSKSDGGGGDDEGDDDNPFPYVIASVNPTRNGSSLIMCTWNSASMPQGVSLYRADLYLTKTPYQSVKYNQTWSIDDDNPFSETMSYDYHINLTNLLPDGEIYRGYTTANGYYALFFIAYYDNARDEYWGYYYETARATSSNFITSSAPAVSYDGNKGEISIGKLCYGRRIIEFHRTDTPYGGGTGINDEGTLNEMLLTSLINMERSNPYQGYYYLNSVPTIYRWQRGRYTIGVDFRSYYNNSVMNNAINDAIQKVNAIMNEFGVSFTRSGTSGDISIIVDRETVLYPDAAANNYYYGGTWETTTSGSTITGATIKLACDYQNYACYTSYEATALEELLQSMGAGYDQLEYYDDTIHIDFNYYNKPDYISTRDANILRLVYSDEINAGDDYITVSRKLNIPKGCYMPTTSESDTEIIVPYSQFLESGATYEIRAFIVNSYGQVSATSAWKTITTPARPKTGCYIYHNGIWKPATPHIYNGSRWVEATPHVYSGEWN